MQTCFNESKLRKQICIKLTFILFEDVLKSTELLLWVRGRSVNVWFSPFKNFAVRSSQIISSFRFAVGFWEVQSIESQNLQNTNCVLNEYFLNCFISVTKILGTGGHNRFAKSVYPRPQTGLRYMWQSATANQRARIRKNCHRNRWLTSTKNIFGRWEKFLEGRVLEKTAVKYDR